MGFTKAELKTMILSDPFIFTQSMNDIYNTVPSFWTISINLINLISVKDLLRRSFDFIHNTLKIPHAKILEYPKVLRGYSSQLKARHDFLEKKGRAQYDPENPNYVSLKALATGNDEEFCERVAKCSVNEYNSFLKRVLWNCMYIYNNLKTKTFMFCIFIYAKSCIN